MKKCPYCAEEIQDEAIVCRYCGKDLQPQIPAQAQKRKEPPTGISLLFGILLFVAIYGFAYLIVQYSDPTSDPTDILSFYQVIVALAVTLLAVPGLDPTKGGALRYIGIFILSLLPIVGWIVLFWAGRTIARTVTQR